MDPSIMKFLEEDEDETMHSGADVDAFTAALNRDIQGQFESLWQPTSNNENTDQNQQEQPEQHSSEVQVKLEPSSDYLQQEDIASQHVKPPPKYIYQDVLQTPQAIDSQCHDKTPMDINELGGKVKLESVINQHAVTAGMHNHPGAIGTGNLQVPARGMNVQHSSSLVMKNQQAVTTGVGNHQLMAGSGVHSQQLPRRSVLQQSPASGMTNQQSVAIGINNQQAIAMGIHNQQPMTSGMSNQPVFNSGLSNQQAMTVGVANQQANSSNRAKQVPFARLLPILTPLLDKDRGMQLEALYKKLKGNEIAKETFVRHMRAIVGDQMLKRGVYKLQQQDSKEDAAMQRISNVQIKAESNDSTLDNNALQPYEVGGQGDSHHMQLTQMSSSYGSASSQQKHLHLSQTWVPKIVGTGNNRHPYSTSNVTTSAASLKQAHDSQMRQLPVHRNNAVHLHTGNNKEQKNILPLSSDQQQRSHSPASQGLSSVPIHAKLENSKNYGFKKQTSKMGASVSASRMDHNIPNSRVPSAPSPVAAENSAKTPIKKPSIGQKMPLEALDSSPPPSSSKKQKVSGAGFLDQSIDHLNDVTVVSGVDLREEEQLFSGPKEDNRVSESSRRLVQEEEDRLLLKIPLKKKLAEIMAKSGLKSIGSDVNKCLSLCVEERMRGLMSNLIRMSKQRVDREKSRYRTIITTDVRKKITAINQKVRVEREKKLAEEGKLQRLNGAEESDGDKEKDESRARPVKVVANKEENEKMRTTAANVAARAAVGGSDMLLKWKLMAQQSRQEQEGETDQVADKDVFPKTSTVGKNARDLQESEKRCQLSSAPGSIRKLGRNQVIMAQNRVARAISVKDVVAVLEREPQMLRSTLMYRLYDKFRSESSAY